MLRRPRSRAGRGHCRRSATARTHGTRASDARAASRSIVKNVPRSSPRTTASRCAPLARVERRRHDHLAERERRQPRRPSRRAAHARQGHARSASASTAIAFSWRASSHMRALAGSRRKGRERRAGLRAPPSARGCARSCPATCSLRGTSTCRRRAGSGRAGPSRCSRRRRTRASDCARISLSFGVRHARSGRSTSSRRRSTCCGSRSCPAAPRCGSAAARGR